MKTKVVGMLDIKGMDVIRRVYDSDFLSPTISTCGGGKREPKIIQLSTACAIRGREGKQNLELSNREVGNAITSVQKDSMVNEMKKEGEQSNIRIRKLTPKECWRSINGF